MVNRIFRLAVGSLAVKRIYGVLESCVLLMIGIGILWFSLSDHYELLMNTKFRPLTLTGAVLVLVLGVATVAGRRKGVGANMFVFAVMGAVVVIGKPYLPAVGSIDQASPEFEAALWEQVDLMRYPRVLLLDLSSRQPSEEASPGNSVTTVGVVKRLEGLTDRTSFALMTTFMYCCLADAVGFGVRVQWDDLDSIKDGQLAIVSGTVYDEEAPMRLPNFRSGRAMVSSVSKSRYLVADQILSYRAEDQLPTMADAISGPRKEGFSQALTAARMWGELAGTDRYTVFVPVDLAIDDMDGLKPGEMSPTALESFVSAHIVRGDYSLKKLVEAGAVSSLSGGVIKVHSVNGETTVNGSRVLLKNRRTRNGVIHFIYPVLTTDASVL